MTRVDELGRKADAIFQAVGKKVATAKVTKALVSPNEVPRGILILAVAL